jgi:hypothetical protein
MGQAGGRGPTLLLGGNADGQDDLIFWAVSAIASWHRAPLRLEDMRTGCGDAAGESFRAALHCRCPYDRGPCHMSPWTDGTRQVGTCQGQDMAGRLPKMRANRFGDATMAASLSRRKGTEDPHQERPPSFHGRWTPRRRNLVHGLQTCGAPGQRGPNGATLFRDSVDIFQLSHMLSSWA